MKVVILTLGTRGDVQPFVAFGQGLWQAGHQVRVVASASFEPLVREHGLDFGPMRDDTHSLLDERTLRQRVGGGVGQVQSIRDLMREMREVLARMREDSWLASQDADVIVDATNGWGYHIAEKLGVPLVRSNNMPYTPTRFFASPSAPELPLGGLYNWLTYTFTRRMAWQTVRDDINTWRQETLGLPPIHTSPETLMDRQRVPYIYAYSPVIIPRPADWPDWIRITSFWLTAPPRDWQPPQRLVDFLESGPPPVYVGFGSMTTDNPEETTALVTDALRRAGQRGVLLTGWGALSQTAGSDDLLVIDDVPHTWLFPRMAAVVFHGTPGTGAAVFQAGVPCVPVPFFADQPFWSRRIAQHGIGTEPIPRRWLSSSKLTAAIIEATTNERMRQRAAEYGRLIRAEDGVARGVDAFHQCVATPVHVSC